MLVARNMGYCVLSAAFDTIDHVILYSQTWNLFINIRHSFDMVKLLTSTHRSVGVNSVLSEPLAVKWWFHKVLHWDRFFSWSTCNHLVRSSRSMAYNTTCTMMTPKWILLPPERFNYVVTCIKLCIDKVQSWLLSIRFVLTQDQRFVHSSCSLWRTSPSPTQSWQHF